MMLLLTSSASQDRRIFTSPNKAVSWALDFFFPPLTVLLLVSDIIGNEGLVNQIIQNYLLIAE